MLLFGFPQVPYELFFLSFDFIVMDDAEYGGVYDYGSTFHAVDFGVMTVIYGIPCVFAFWAWHSYMLVTVFI